MSVKTVFVELEQDVVAFLEGAGKAFKAFVVTEEQKAVIVLKQHETIVTRALNLISDLKDSTLSGSEKMDKVVADLEGDYDAFVQAGGFNGILESGISILRQFAESVYSDFAATLAKL